MREKEKALNAWRDMTNELQHDRDELERERREHSATRSELDRERAVHAEAQARREEEERR
jgi:hypothetical protein